MCMHLKPEHCSNGKKQEQKVGHTIEKLQDQLNIGFTNLAMLVIMCRTITIMIQLFEKRG